MHESSSSQIEQLHAANSLLAVRLTETNEYVRIRYQYQLARMRHCSHRRGQAQHCGSPLCLLCRRWKNEHLSCLFKSQLHNLHSKGKTRLLAATATVGDVDTTSLRPVAKHLGSSWNRLMKQVHGLKGDFRAIEISPRISSGIADPSKEHLHLHGFLAMSPSSCTGRYYRSKQAWTAAWEDAAGETASSLKIDPLRDIDYAVEYCLPFSYVGKDGKKGFLRQAEDALSDPQRYLERVTQLSGLHKCRYRGELNPYQLSKAELSDQTDLLSHVRRSFERTIAYQCDPHRKDPPKLLPIASL
jgi:hypothetical protein